MIRILRSISSVLPFLLIFPVFPAEASFKKTKIAVLDFQLHGERHETADMGKIVAEWLITALVKEGRFDVIERSLLEKVLHEQKLGVSGVVDEQYASRLGRVLGAKVVISGSLMKLQNMTEVNARIIDVETGAVIAAEIARSTSTAKLEDLVVQMADKIIKDFPLEGYVVRRNENTVLLDLGRRSGVKKGMRFMVYKEGNVIKHPKTGEILDIERIETGTIEIINLGEKTSDAAILTESGPDTIRYGQLVKSWKEAGSIAAPQQARPAAKQEKIQRQPSAMPQDIAGVEASIEEMKNYRKSGNSDWKRKNKDIQKAMKSLDRTYGRSPEMAIAHAKYYAALDNIDEAEEYISQAMRHKQFQTEAFIYKGDMYLEASHKKIGYAKDAARAYEKAAMSTSDTNLRSELFLKVGNIFADVLVQSDKAADFWKKAVSAQPDGEPARTASDRLERVKQRR